MANPIIRVENLGKKYRLGQENRAGTGLRHVIEDAVRNPLKFFKGIQSPTEEFWALRNISFELEKGDVLGVIGHNGAGKSTLLKLLSRVTEPTEGCIRLRGRIACLLEVGTGFHHELTGRENVFLNGSILGMSRVEIKKKFDAIVSFAGVEKFIDVPVKRYSTGMMVRLAFAVAAHLEPEILIVDEVLAVGDAEFQKKCIGKMEDVASKEGKTILFVSHSMASVRRLCTKGLLLKKGSVVQLGKVADVVDSYVKALNTDDGATSLTEGEKDFSFLSIQTRQGDGTGSTVFNHDEPIEIIIRYRTKREIPELALDMLISNASEVPVFTVHRSSHQKKNIPPGTWEAKITIPALFLIPDRYVVSLLAHVMRRETFQTIDRAVSFEINETGSDMDGYGTRFGSVMVPFRWEEKAS